MGVRVNKRDLRPGDLVFFRTRAGMHVGFYDTDHNFLHASSSQGVMRSSLDNPYWESAFYQARRLPKEYNAQITDEQRHPASGEESPLKKPQPGLRRVVLRLIRTGRSYPARRCRHR